MAKPSKPGAKWKYIEEWFEVADTLGYSSITEMLSDLYDQHQSIRKVARITGFSDGNILRRYHCMEKKLKSQGGANNPWGQKRKPENRINTTYEEEVNNAYS